MKMVRRPMYDNITFHRVVRHQMIQSGDPTGLGSHNCGFTIRDEYLPGLRFDRPGRLAMANVGKENTGGCQFFITDQAIPSWDNKYAIFGQVVSGLDVVRTINRKPLVGEKPVAPVTLKHVGIMRISLNAAAATN
jgi:cyclophilin family peptidyl-prolyl cis-trans isomerase